MSAIISPNTKPLVLGGRAFSVPPLPLRVTIRAYPILCELFNSLFIERLDPVLGGPSEQEMARAAEVVFLVAQAADPELTREAFDALPISPQQLGAGVTIGNFQSGAWRPVEPGAAPGETPGEPEPPTSTSAVSSRSSSAISISRRIIGWIGRRFRTGSRSIPAN